jgi:hypothetical protein
MTNIIYVNHLELSRPVSQTKRNTAGAQLLKAVDDGVGVARAVYVNRTKGNRLQSLQTVGRKHHLFSRHLRGNVGVYQLRRIRQTLVTVKNWHIT